MNYDNWNSSINRLLIDVAPVLPDTRCQIIFSIFERNPDIPGIAVTDQDGTVVGLVNRKKCLSMLARPLMRDLYDKRPVSLIMEQNPVLFPITDSLDDVTLRLATCQDQTMLEGFILSHEGRYVGMGKVIDLLTQTAEQNKQRTEVFELALREAEEASRYRGEFLANMSHEIRTPMNAIMGMTQLAMRLNNSKQARNYLDKILNASESLLGIINDILDFSKIDAGRMTLETIDFDLETLISDVATAFELKANEKGLELLTSIDPSLSLNLVGDPLRLRQVLLNLCSNAVKFTPTGEVLIKVERIDALDGQVGLRFCVMDTGIGLSEDQINRLFQAFTQADTSTTRQYGGTGLGLVICKQLSELMGGTIGVSSSIGKGSTFWFTAYMTESTKIVKAKKLTPYHSALRVLIVDDNSSARTIFKEYLSSVCAHVEAVSSGQQAIDVLSGTVTPFDLLLLDWKMPHLNGIETHVPPVIMVSAYDQDELISRAPELHISAFLTKPFSHRRLLETLDSVLQDYADGGFEVISVTDANPTNHRWSGDPILLVDDNEFNLELATEFLQQAGFTVTVAENGKVALDYVQTHSFCCVLMDIQMPVMDGFTATTEIRKNKAFDTLPIIAMTADAMQCDRNHAFESGMNDFISKPINIEKMFETISTWVKPTGSKTQHPS
jgi:two-component system, sensor histidine kinase and response regulator